MDLTIEDRRSDTEVTTSVNGVVRFDGSNEMEYISAGHVPLLHYRRRSGDIVRYSMSQFPLGLFAATGYVSRRVRHEAGDVFALVTDGIVEVGEDQDADFGFERLAQILHDLSGGPLPDIAVAVNAEVKRYGTQQDDQTILLVRTAAASRDIVPGWLHGGRKRAEVHETSWRNLLDELANELACA